jgi:hypothetical protein
MKIANMFRWLIPKKPPYRGCIPLGSEYSYTGKKVDMLVKTDLEDGHWEDCVFKVGTRKTFGGLPGFPYRHGSDNPLVGKFLIGHTSMRKWLLIENIGGSADDRDGLALLPCQTYPATEHNIKLAQRVNDLYEENQTWKNQLEEDFKTQSEDLRQQFEKGTPCPA